MKILANIFGMRKNERKRGIMRRAGAILCALCLTAAMPVVALADSDRVEIDPDRTDGSITLELGYSNSAGESRDMEGGTIGLYMVAAVKSDGDQTFDISKGRFADSAAARSIPGMSEDTLNAKNSSIASSLAAAASEDMADQIKPVSNGGVSFKGLKPGLYLVKQIRASKDSVTINPFLISVPYKGQFQVAAKPKAGIRVPNKPTSPDKPKGKTSRPPKKGSLPRTGQLWWPVFAGVALGMFLIVSGLAVRRRDRRQ